jgi:hypothetical protein
MPAILKHVEGIPTIFLFMFFIYSYLVPTCKKSWLTIFLEREREKWAWLPIIVEVDRPDVKGNKNCSDSIQ